MFDNRMRKNIVLFIKKLERNSNSYQFSFARVLLYETTAINLSFAYLWVVIANLILHFLTFLKKISISGHY